ncbi:ABC transporter transmembrane domain-containing protein, partial [Rhodococcus erythropolis]|nr:ABC transporter transmembrane domain-containing protein [Rhodococcus erythropolis]
MIRDLDEILGRDNGMRGQIAGFTLAGILEGVVFALMIPILKAVVRGDYDAAVPWVVTAALVAVACGAVRWIAENRAYRIGIEGFAGGIMHRLGEHLVQVPLGWFSKANRGAFTRLVTEGTAILMSIPGMIIAQLVTVTVTPATVAIAVLFVDWRLSLAMVVFVPLGIRAYRNVQRAVVPEYEAIGKSESELASRVVEYAQAQQVLRSAGKSGEGWTRLDEALVSNRDAHLQEIGSVDKYLLRFMIVVQVAFLTVLVLAALLVTTGSIDTASVIVVLVLAVRFVEPMQMLAGFGEGISLARVSLGSVREMIDVPVLAEPEVPKEPTSYDIRFDSV